jgi:hypothetical protein
MAKAISFAFFPAENEGNPTFEDFRGVVQPEQIWFPHVPLGRRGGQH